MHDFKVPDRDDTHRKKRPTGLSSVATSACEGVIDRPIPQDISHATSCIECHVLREKEELLSKLFGLHDAAEKRLGSLTVRERQVMKLVLSGHPSKNIAADLGINQRTVENHRASIMRRTGSNSLPELIHLAIAAHWTMPVARSDGSDSDQRHR